MSDTELWMPLHIGDYLADTVRLNTEQHGAYLLLLMECWRKGPPPANDMDLAGITRLDLRGWLRNKRTLLRFFSQREGKLFHQRIEEERAEARRQRSALRERAVKGARARWAGHVTGQAQGSSQALLKQSGSEAREPDAGESTGTFLSLVTTGGGMFHVDHGYVRRLQGEFPALDVAREFRLLQAWVEGNPRNRKTAQGVTRFIGNWMGRARDRALRQVQGQGQEQGASA